MNTICERCYHSIPDEHSYVKGHCQLYIDKVDERCYKGTINFYGTTLVPGKWYNWDDKPGEYHGDHTSMYTGYFLTQYMTPEMVDRWGKAHHIHEKFQDVHSIKEVSSQQMSGLSIFHGKDYTDFCKFKG